MLRLGGVLAAACLLAGCPADPVAIPTLPGSPAGPMLSVRLPREDAFGLVVSAGSVDGPAGGVAITWRERPVVAMPDGGVLRLAGNQALSSGKLLPVRGRLDRTHVRYLGSASHPDLDHWYRDIFRRGDEVKVVDEVGLRLGKRASVVIVWDVRSGVAPAWQLFGPGTGRLTWDGFELEVHSTQTVRASLREREPGTWRLRLATDDDATGQRLSTTLRRPAPVTPR